MWRYSCSGLGELGGRPVYMMPLQQGDSGDTSPYTSPKHREYTPSPCWCPN